MKLCDILKDKRNRLGWSREEFSRMVGIDEETIIHLENGDSIPNPFDIDLVAKIFFFLDEDEDNFAEQSRVTDICVNDNKNKYNFLPSCIFYLSLNNQEIEAMKMFKSMGIGQFVFSSSSIENKKVFIDILKIYVQISELNDSLSKFICIYEIMNNPYIILDIANGRGENFFEIQNLDEAELYSFINSSTLATIASFPFLLKDCTTPFVSQILKEFFYINHDEERKDTYKSIALTKFMSEFRFPKNIFDESKIYPYNRKEVTVYATYYGNKIFNRVALDDIVFDNMYAELDSYIEVNKIYKLTGTISLKRDENAIMIRLMNASVLERFENNNEDVTEYLE